MTRRRGTKKKATATLPGSAAAASTRSQVLVGVIAASIGCALIACWNGYAATRDVATGSRVRKQGERFTLLPPVASAPGVRRFHVPVRMAYPQAHVVDAEVVAVDNFLPLDLAERWRDRMDQQWTSEHSQGNFEQLDPADTRGWLYTTNDANSKSRGNANIVNRSMQSERMRQAGRFAYSKWELAPEHALVHEMQAHLASKETRAKVQALVGSKDLNDGMADIFVTQYAPSNFLTEHNDAYSGTWAIVLSLATSSPETEWQPGYGGELAFRCHADLASDFRGADPKVCRKLAPRFNSAVLFRTNNPTIGPPHQVLPVTDAAGEAGFRRFGLTAWYTEVDEVVSKEFERENLKMRGKLLKGHGT